MVVEGVAAKLPRIVQIIIEMQNFEYIQVESTFQQETEAKTTDSPLIHKNQPTRFPFSP
jgi:hypothetical protein